MLGNFLVAEQMWDFYFYMCVLMILCMYRCMCVFVSLFWLLGI